MGDLEPFSPGGVEFCDDFGGAAPRGRSAEFEVRYLHADASFARDANDFIDCLEDSSGLEAHVGGVDAVEFCCDFCKGNEFVRFGERTWDIDEAGAKSEGTGAHGFREKRLHAFLFLRRWGAAEDSAHRDFAEGVVACESADVDGGFGFINGIEEGADVG